MKLTVRCGFCVRGGCQFRADCRRTKRLAEFGSARIESVAPTDLRGDARDKEVFTFGSGATDAAVVSGDSGNVGAADGDGDFGFRVVGATPESAKALAFGRRKVGVVKRPWRWRERVVLVVLVRLVRWRRGRRWWGRRWISSSLYVPKPRRKEEKEKRKEKVAVKAAVDAAEKTAEGDPGAAEAAAVTAVLRAAKLRGLEVLTIGSDPIDKISETAEKEKAADAAEKTMCPLVAAMLAVETTKATMIVEAADAAEEKAAAVAAAAAADRKKTKTLLEMRAIQQDRKKTGEKAEDRAERLRKSLANSMW